MGLLTKKITVTAPVTGRCAPVTECSDPVFSNKALGDGVVLYPTDGRVVSPVDGTLIQLSHTRHAFIVQSTQGAQLLVHLGINTVLLEGAPFTPHCAVGDKISVGQLLMEVDLDKIAAAGLSAETPCILLNGDAFSKLTPIPGEVIAGEDPILTLAK